MRSIATFFLSIALLSGIFAQAPQKMSYQSVLRDNNNQLIKEQTVGMQVSIIQGTPVGMAVYVETQTPATNINGLITIEIGSGSTTDNFSAIDWSNGPYFIKTETDPNGGTNYTITGTSQLLSVPYAIHAETAKKLVGSIAANIYPPSVIASAANNIESFSATINGIVNAEGFSATVVFEWGTTTNYGNTINAIQSPVTGSTDVMVSANLSNLQSATTYHYRICATNAVNVIYSEDILFTTNISVPQLTTNTVTNILAFSATCGGNITYDGGSPVISRGIVWSTNPNPTLDDNHTVVGVGTGSFTSDLTGLSHSTIYYVRAYAISVVGTSYGNQITFMTYAGINGEPCIGSETLIDFDGNIYNTVVIGPQCWMKENLKTNHYRNGTPIEYPGSDNNSWNNNSTGAYAWYDNDISWKDSYGALYNWHAVNNANGLCPTGWHVQTEPEFMAMRIYLGSSFDAGGKMKSTRTVPDPHPRWESPNWYATNESNWSGLPGGLRDSYNGIFSEIGTSGYWWSSSEVNTYNASARFLYYQDGYPMIIERSKRNGFSVRCLRDN